MNRLILSSLNRLRSAKLIAPNARQIRQISVYERRLAQKNEQKEELNPNEPIKYFGSEAAKWSAFQTRSGVVPNSDTLWYQPFVVMTSVIIFMLYFCVFREESDIDLELSKNLYDRVDGLEEVQLKLNHKYNTENKLSVADIESRMKEMGIAVPKYD